MTEAFEKQAEYLKAIAHPTRIAILRILEVEKEACVCHINAVLNELRQAYISQQLTVLRKANIIQPRKEGWNVYYSVENKEIFQLINMVEEILKIENPIHSLNLNPPNCNCGKCSL